MADESHQKTASVAEQNQGKAYARQNTKTVSTEENKQHQTCLERVESSCKNCKSSKDFFKNITYLILQMSRPQA